MNRNIIAATTFALTAALTGAAFAQGAGKVSTNDIHFAVPPAPSASLRLTTASMPYYVAYRGGVRVAVGDVNNDGAVDLVGVAGPGGNGHVKVFDGKTGAEIRSFTAASVGAGEGDVNGDGAVDIIINTGPARGGHVKVFDGKTGAELHVELDPQGRIIPAGGWDQVPNRKV